MGQTLQIVPVRPGVCYGAWRNVLLLAYQSAPTVEDLLKREALVERVLVNFPHGAFISVLDVSGSSSQLPDAASRAETARQLERMAPRLRAGAIVMRGEGVRASLLRSFMRGVLLVRRTPFPHRFFDDSGGAARFCLERLGDCTEEDIARLSIAADAVAEQAKLRAVAPQSS
jgi:hypothetical protein